MIKITDDELNKIKYLKHTRFLSSLTPHDVLTEPTITHIGSLDQKAPTTSLL